MEKSQQSKKNPDIEINPYQIALIVTFRPGGNSWVTNSQWQLLSSPISSPGRLASTEQRQGHFQTIFHLHHTTRICSRSKAELLLLALGGAKINFQVGFKPVSQFVSVVSGLCGKTWEKGLGAELKDSADGLQLYLNFLWQVLSSHHQLHTQFML